MMVLLLESPITLSDVYHFVGRETMFKELTYQRRINLVELIVGRDKWFSIHMPEVITIRTFWKKESRIIVAWTLFGKRITNTTRECL